MARAPARGRERAPKATGGAAPKAARRRRSCQARDGGGGDGRPRQSPQLGGAGALFEPSPRGLPETRRRRCVAHAGRRRRMLPPAVNVIATTRGCAQARLVGSGQHDARLAAHGVVPRRSDVTRRTRQSAGERARHRAGGGVEKGGVLKRGHQIIRRIDHAESRAACAAEHGDMQWRRPVLWSAARRPPARRRRRRAAASIVAR